MTDPIADMIIRIKNAVMVNKSQVELPHSTIKEAIAKILLENSLIEKYNVVKQVPQSKIVIDLKYIDGLSAITDVKRVSKSGRRLYSSAAKLEKTLGGYGITIISTSKGLMTDSQARKSNLGGEVICQIW